MRDPPVCCISGLPREQLSRDIYRKREIFVKSSKAREGAIKVEGFAGLTGLGVSRMVRISTGATRF